MHSRNFLLIIQDGEGSPLLSLFFTGWRRSGGGPFLARSVPPHLSSVLLFERAIREGAISQAFHNETGRRQGNVSAKNFTILNAFSAKNRSLSRKIYPYLEGVRTRPIGLLLFRFCFSSVHICSFACLFLRNEFETLHINIKVIHVLSNDSFLPHISLQMGCVRNCLY